MNGEELRERQAPVKARYREDATAAIETLRARGRVDQEALSCALETGKPGVPAGLHPRAGGDGSGACSGDMLLEALVGCVPDKLTKLLELTERYCVVAQTLRQGIVEVALA